jgi:hypothetical protein
MRPIDDLAPLELFNFAFVYMYDSYHPRLLPLLQALRGTPGFIYHDLYEESLVPILPPAYMDAHRMMFDTVPYQSRYRICDLGAVGQLLFLLVTPRAGNTHDHQISLLVYQCHTAPHAYRLRAQHPLDLSDRALYAYRLSAHSGTVFLSHPTLAPWYAYHLASATFRRTGSALESAPSGAPADTRASYTDSGTTRTFFFQDRAVWRETLPVAAVPRNATPVRARLCPPYLILRVPERATWVHLEQAHCFVHLPGLGEEETILCLGQEEDHLVFLVTSRHSSVYRLTLPIHPAGPDPDPPAITIRPVDCINTHFFRAVSAPERGFYSSPCYQEWLSLARRPMALEMGAIGDSPTLSLRLTTMHTPPPPRTGWSRLCLSVLGVLVVCCCLVLGKLWSRLVSRRRKK